MQPVNYTNAPRQPPSGYGSSQRPLGGGLGAPQSQIGRVSVDRYGVSQPSSAPLKYGSAARLPPPVSVPQRPGSNSPFASGQGPVWASGQGPVWASRQPGSTPTTPLIANQSQSSTRETTRCGHWGVKSEETHEALYGISPTEVHNAFVAKVYAILAVELSATAIICCIMMFVTPIRLGVIHFIHHYPLTYQILLLTSLLSSLCFLFCVQRMFPANVFALGLFVFFMSINVGAECCIVYQRGLGPMIFLAVAITAAIFTSLSVYAHVSNADFSYLFGFLFACTCALLMLGIVMLFLPIQTLYVMYCTLGIVLFCGWILFDTWKLKNVFGPDDAIIASIDLYLDLINIFGMVLALLGDR